MRFSIICTILNGEKFLEEAIESVLKQTFSNWELLLVDSGSTDRTPIICDYYSKKDSRIKAIYKENEGQLVDRFFGLSKSTGDYILFLDSDDYYDINSLRILDTLLNNKTPDIVIFNYIRKIDDKLYPTKLSFLEDAKSLDFFRKYLLCGYINSLWIKCFRKALFVNDYHYYKKLESYAEEDLLFSLEPFDHANHIEYLDSYLYYYRINNSSISHSAPDINRFYYSYNEFILKLLLQYRKIWCLPDSIDAILVENKCKQIYDITSRFLRATKLKEVPLFVKKIKSIYPVNQLRKKDLRNYNLNRKEITILASLIKSNYVVIFSFFILLRFLKKVRLI